MTEAFDPYRRWLGIPNGERPPNHYALLGLSLFEQDADAISNAADRQMAYVRTLQTGPHGALSQQLLNELAAARLCLLSAARKAQYDTGLKAKLAPAPQPAAPLPVPTLVAAPAPLSTPRIQPWVASNNAAAPSIAPRPIAVRGLSVRGLRGKLPGWAAPAAGGFACGLLLAWIAMSLGGRNPAAGAKANPAAIPPGAGQAAKQPSGDPPVVSIFKSIERPNPLGVVAEKLVIWNTHNAYHRDRGALECNVRLMTGGREVWSKVALAMPWAPNEDRSLTMALPHERFDCVRVEITKWEQNGGGLGEIQVLSADGRNLAIGCPTAASGALWGRFDSERLADGVTASGKGEAGYWLLPDKLPGWVEVDLSLPRPPDLAGVTAEKLVIWNTHNGPHNDFGTLECNVRLLAGVREVWSKDAVAVPWAPNEDRNITAPLPPKRFDRVRVEVTKWERLGGGLAEIQVQSGDGRNLALGCPALTNGVWDNRFDAADVTDGIVNSESSSVGYWVLPDNAPGWIEVDLACLDAKYGAACRQLGLARALLDGDWQRGLPWLARGDDRALRRLAFADSRDVGDTPEQLALGDAWWDRAQQAEGEAKRRLLARSLWRYRQALHKLYEFRKPQIQARFDEALPDLPERDYLYFMQEAELKLGWGEFREAWPISVRGVRSPYGLFMHPVENGVSHAAFHLGKRYRRFRGAAAINDAARGLTATALTFRIVGDGRELWKSSPLKETGSSEAFDADIASVDKLELFVDCPGGGYNAMGSWIEPRCDP